MRSDHEVLLKVNGEEYKVFIEREWEWDGGEAVDDNAEPMYVNDVPIEFLIIGFADQVREAVDKWITGHEPPRREPPEYELEPKEEV